MPLEELCRVIQEDFPQYLEDSEKYEKAANVMGALRKLHRKKGYFPPFFQIPVSVASKGVVKILQTGYDQKVLSAADASLQVFRASVYNRTGRTIIVEHFPSNNANLTEQQIRLYQFVMQLQRRLVKERTLTDADIDEFVKNLI